MQPTFGTAAVLIAPSAPLLSTGYVPGNTLAAQHLNYYLFHLTKELNNLLALAGLSPSGAVDTQVGAAVQWVATAGVVVSLTTSSPYTLTAYGASAVEVNGTANPYIVNLPQASTCIGYCVEILNASTIGSGLVQITPYSGDAIGQVAANTSIYLQNVDASGAKSFQSVRLRATANGWTVLSGQFAPHQAIDTDGSQIHLGKLIHFPLDNSAHTPVDRQLYSSTGAAQGAWTAAIQAAGIKGIPAGAKGISARIYLNPYSSTSNGAVAWWQAFSDNVASTPSPTVTAHPCAETNGYGYFPTDGLVSTFTEIDIPLNSAGQFYAYCMYALNVTIASSHMYIVAVGFCMGV